MMFRQKLLAYFEGKGHEALQIREVMDIKSTDEEVFEYARSHGLLMLTCNRDDFLKIAQQHPGGSLIVLIRRRTRQAECAHLLKLISRAGEAGLDGNINFA